MRYGQSTISSRSADQVLVFEQGGKLRMEEEAVAAGLQVPLRGRNVTVAFGFNSSAKIQTHLRKGKSNHSRCGISS